MKHLEESNILYHLQHGFRSSRSCETQLISFVQDLAQSADKKIQTDLIIMDFAKAFDKVSYDAYKMSFYPRTIVQWNQLPTSVVTAETVEGFKGLLTVPVLIPILD